MNPFEQHVATRRAAGLFDFSFMGLYEFADKSAIQPLQTRDLDALAPGQIAYTLLLKTDGSVLLDATVWRLDAERFWLFTGKRGMYLAKDRSGEYAILALQGPDSGRILSRLIGADPVRALGYFRFLESGDMIVARLGFSGELGYELLVPAAAGPRLRQALLDEGVPDCSFAAADSLRIESGYVLFDREIDGRANPRELGLERLVALPQNYSVTRRLMGLEILDGSADGNAPVAALTSECVSPILGKSIALGFVAPETTAGQFLRVGDGWRARACALPFVDPERRRPRGAPLQANTGER